jgi:hypothetical protein
MHSLPCPRITRWIITCIQPKEMAAARAKYTQQFRSDSGELAKEAEDDRKAEAAEAPMTRRRYHALSHLIDGRRNSLSESTSDQL